MAHKGQRYKLWYRRDAAWDLNNYVSGWAECYWVQAHGLITSARYAVSQFSQVNAVNIKKTYDRTWESPVYGGFFDNVYWRVEFQGPPDEVVDRARFGIWHDAVIDTPLYTATYRVGVSPFGYGLFELAGLVQLHFLSPDVQVDPDNFRVILTAAAYDRYDP